MKIFCLLLANIWLHTNAQLIVQSGLTHRIEILGGSEQTIAISLKNGGESTLLCTLDLHDVVSHCDSGYRYLPPGSTDESCAPWITIEEESFELQPLEEKIVKVLFRARQGYKNAGARACVMVNSAPAVEKATPKGVQMRVRYAIKVLYRNPAIPGVIALHANTLDLMSNSPFWGITFQNQSNVDRIVRSHAKLLDANGHVVYASSALNAHGFIPNQCRTLRFPNPLIPPGEYHMIVMSETDEGERFGVTKKISWEE